MENTTTFETAQKYGETFQKRIGEAQEQAKGAFDKGKAVLGEAGDFTKGNVEAIVEAGKVLFAGLNDMRGELVAEGRSAFETMTADIKEMRTVKSPAEFIKLQGEITRKNLDSAVATGSKNGEAVIKLVRETVAPISERLSLAVEKVKAARA